MKKLLLILLLPITTFASYSLAESKISATKTSESIGTYNNGCFANGEKLPFSGNGYEVVKIERKRFYGNPELVKFIGDLGNTFEKKYNKKLLISDLSQENGGPMHGDHASHQIGLDVDIWNSFLPQRQILTNKQRNNLKANEIVKSDGKTLTKNWSEANEIAIINAATDERVDRIFVNPAIKNRFCKMYPKNANQYKIRAWWGHDKHFHVRLKCPKNSPDCTIENKLDIADNGCKPEQLNWWLSGEAYAELKKNKATKTKKFEKKLPERCIGVVGKNVGTAR
jgi:penicillin-insensitive murein endopeptidase